MKSSAVTVDLIGGDGEGICGQRIALACTLWGLKQMDLASNGIYITNVKPPDFEPCEPFIIKGRPSLDQTGYFEMTLPPGYAGNLGELRRCHRIPAVCFGVP